MLRSLYSGVSGMKGFQSKMDVIANNIANVNTTAYKSSRIKFQDMLSQTISNAQAPGTNYGGVNPKQVGLGVKIGSIDAMMEGGAMQPTNRNLDFAIEGDGFFAVSSMVDNTTGEAQNLLYTRDGSFFKDSGGDLVNANGEKVLGYKPDASGNITVTPTTTLVALDIPNENPSDVTQALQSYSVDGTGTITAVYGEGILVTLGRVAVTTFSTPEGMERVGNNNFINTRNSGGPRHGSAGDAGFGTVRQGFLEMSNVDLANEFTEMVIASRAYSANSRSITTSDEMLQELINLKR